MPVQIQKISITHDAIIDYCIVNPAATYREIGAKFGYTEIGIGIIVRSDAFKARLEQRKAELVDPLIKQNLEERLDGLAMQSVDILARKLAVSEDPKLALATLDSVTRARGYGAKNQTAVQNNFVVHLPGPAANSTEWASRFAPPSAPVLVPQVGELPSQDAAHE